MVRLHNHFYLLKILVRISAYKMFSIVYFLDTLKSWITIWQVFCIVETKTKMKCNRKNNVSFLCQLVCSLTALPWQLIAGTLLSFSRNLMYICSLQKLHEENSLLEVPGRRMRGKSHKVKKGRFQMDKKIKKEKSPEDN